MNIVLIGFMGAGKTTVARLLAQRLNLKWVDTDDLVEDRAGLKTHEIFHTFGEVRYRELEIEVGKLLQGSMELVIATGGGVVLNKLILDYLTHKGGIIIYLDATFETLRLRVKSHSRPRPLFQDVSKAKELYRFRLPIYKKYADVTVTTEHKRPKQIVSTIISYISKTYL